MKNKPAGGTQTVLPVIALRPHTTWNPYSTSSIFPYLKQNTPTTNVLCYVHTIEGLKINKP